MGIEAKLYSRWGATTLIVCLLLDAMDYLVPLLTTPFLGDLIDFTGVAFAILSFGWVGAKSLLEVIPGVDLIPVFTITWIAWYLYYARVERKLLQNELERWR